MYKLIKNGTRSPIGKDCVFLWVVSEPHRVYKDYPEKNKGLDELTVPTVLVGFRRKDNAFGTVGGKVDQGEDLITGLARECKEEMGIDIQKDFKESDVKPLATFNDNDVHIHSYYVTVNPEYMKYARNEFRNATHGAEWCGVNEIVIDDKIEEFFENKFAATAKLELRLLLQELCE